MDSKLHHDIKQENELQNLRYYATNKDIFYVACLGCFTSCPAVISHTSKSPSFAEVFS